MPTLTLAQDDAAAVSTLPPPPLLDRLLFEQPLPTAGGLLLAGVVAFLVINRTGEGRRALIAGGIAVLLAGGVLLVGVLVTTTRERLQARTVELIDAAATADIPRLEPLLSPDVRLGLWERDLAAGRGRVLDSVKDYVGTRYKVKEHSVAWTSATVDGPNVARSMVRVRVRTEATMYDFPTGSTWRIDWRLEGGEWRASGIRCLQIDGVGAPSLPGVR